MGMPSLRGLEIQFVFFAKAKIVTLQKVLMNLKVAGTLNAGGVASNYSCDNNCYDKEPALLFAITRSDEKQNKA
ncbi:MAG: hypothetical protein WD425_01615 [Nitrospirales bacterium]